MRCHIRSVFQHCNTWRAYITVCRSDGIVYDSPWRRHKRFCRKSLYCCRFLYRKGRTIFSQYVVKPYRRFASVSYRLVPCIDSIGFPRDKSPVDSTDRIFFQHGHDGLECTAVPAVHIFRTYHRSSILFQSIYLLLVGQRIRIIVIGYQIGVLQKEILYFRSASSPYSGSQRL